MLIAALSIDYAERCIDLCQDVTLALSEVRVSQDLSHRNGFFHFLGIQHARLKVESLCRQSDGGRERLQDRLAWVAQATFDLPEHGGGDSALLRHLS